MDIDLNDPNLVRQQIAIAKYNNLKNKLLDSTYDKKSHGITILVVGPGDKNLDDRFLFGLRHYLIKWPYIRRLLVVRNNSYNDKVKKLAKSLKRKYKQYYLNYISDLPRIQQADLNMMNRRIIYKMISLAYIGYIHNDSTKSLRAKTYIGELKYKFSIYKVYVSWKLEYDCKMKIPYMANYKDANGKKIYVKRYKFLDVVMDKKTLEKSKKLEELCKELKKIYTYDKSIVGMMRKIVR